MSDRAVLRRPIVFLGPSLPRAEAATILDADYRPPIKRGDLDDLTSGHVVAIIDGVFDQTLAVSPSEVRAAVRRRVHVLGCSSIGALRAVEVPGVVGVGRVFDLFRTGAIDRDDEVALTFDPDTLRPLSQPLVNVRHAVAQLQSAGTISADHARRIIEAAQALPYGERIYPAILHRAGFCDDDQSRQLSRMLAFHDLKRQDAVLLLELLARSIDSPLSSASDGLKPALEQLSPPAVPAGSLHVWEFGPPLTVASLVRFIALTGALRPYALRAAAILGAGSAPAGEGPEADALGTREIQRLARNWQWRTEEEVAVSLQHLGIDDDGLNLALARRALLEVDAMARMRVQDPRFMEVLTHELFFDELELKRLAARAVSLQWLASAGPPRPSDRAAVAARQAFCRLIDARDLADAVRALADWGIGAADVDDFVNTLARAIAARQTRRATTRRAAMRFQSSPKAGKSRRFCLPLARASAVARRLQPTVGITRVAVITGLSPIGIPNAQAFRPDGQWSSTVGSGKSQSTAGARVGAVMEEVEKWAQERYSFEIERHIVRQATFAELQRGRRNAIDPATLDLPWDTIYRPDLRIAWVTAVDLIAGGTWLAPAAAVTHTCVANDIYYSPFGGRKTVTTNGLASGFTRAEALTHALCECIERHERALDSILRDNPGGPWTTRLAVVDLDDVPQSTRRLLGKIRRGHCFVVVRSISTNVRVPTFVATIMRDDPSLVGEQWGDGWQQASGWATHPDPETALNMAVLEASQTVLTNVAGSREDLALPARSLGRHERTESRRRANTAPELDNGAPRTPFDSVAGYQSRDAAADVRWVVDQLARAGFDHALMVDMSQRRIAPAQVVRCLVPGMETINPFYTGPRARAALLADVLPQR